MIEVFYCPTHGPYTISTCDDKCPKCRMRLIEMLLQGVVRDEVALDPGTIAVDDSPSQIHPNPED